MNEYQPRLIDEKINSYLVIGAILLFGPKGCGKTTTANNIVRVFYN